MTGDSALSLPPLSVLELARVHSGDSISDALSRSLRIAKTADLRGYRRLWFAEHHNMPHVASAATAVLIQHVAAQTRHIRVGAGGVMLPNHSPLVIAEQFGTLETLNPGRIDLGLGRAPGTDGTTVRALRRDGSEAQHFETDVLELSGYLTGRSRVPGVQAYPGSGTDVPLYILGSSLFGAELAARRGLPFAFASHFAPQLLEQAAQVYRGSFTAQNSLAGPGAEPHFIVAVNAIVHDDADIAASQRTAAEDGWIRAMLGRGKTLDDADVAALRSHPAGQHALSMLSRTWAGTADQVLPDLAHWSRQLGADELMVVPLAPDEAVQHRTLELLAPSV